MAYGTLQGTQALLFDEEEGRNVTQISAQEALVSVRLLPLSISLSLALPH